MRQYQAKTVGWRTHGVVSRKVTMLKMPALPSRDTLVRNGNMKQHAYSEVILLKVVIVGDSGIGKSSLLVRFADQTFRESHKGTIGVDFRFKSLRSKKRVVKLQIWDTAGQERFRTMTSAYYRGASGFVLCFSLCDEESFNHMSKWVHELEVYRSEGSVVVLCGTKADKEAKRCVSLEKAQELAEQLGAMYCETSSKTGEGVESLFVEITKKMVSQLKKADASKDDDNDIALDTRSGGGLFDFSAERLDMTKSLDMSCCDIA